MHKFCEIARLLEGHTGETEPKASCVMNGCRKSSLIWRVNSNGIQRIIFSTQTHMSTVEEGGSTKELIKTQQTNKAECYASYR